jgi:hypothetical protein
MATQEHPSDLARLCREQAAMSRDPAAAILLVRMAEHYEAIARATPLEPLVPGAAGPG